MKNGDWSKIRIELIKKFQKTNDVSQIVAGDLQIWPIILFEIKRSISSTLYKESNNIFKFAIHEFFSLISIFFNQVKDKKSNTNKKLKTDYIFLTQSTRRVLFNGKYFDRICDPFVDAFKKCGYNSKVLEWSYDHEFKIPRYNPSSFIQFQIEIELLKNIFFKNNIAYQIEILNSDDFKQILFYCGAEYDQFIKQLKKTIRLIIILARYFDKLIQKESSKAKAAFFYPYYGTVSFAFNLACKWNNINTIEIQHAYNGERAHMQNGIRNQQTKYDLFPDFIWCWEKRDEAAVLQWGSLPEVLPKTYIGGNLWNNLWKYPTQNKNNFYSNVNESIKSISLGYKHVFLLTLSPIYDVPDWLSLAIKKTTKDTLWFIRFHHNTSLSIKNKIKQEFKSITNIHYKIANDLPLPVLLKFSDLHVTIISSCTAEAREFGVETLVLGEDGVVIFKEIIKEGWAYPILSIEEFEVFMQKQILNQKNVEQFNNLNNIKSNKEIILDFINELERFNSEK